MPQAGPHTGTPPQRQGPAHRLSELVPFDLSRKEIPPRHVNCDRLRTAFGSRLLKTTT